MEPTRMLAFSVDVPALSPEEPESPWVWANVDALLDAAELFRVPMTWCVGDVGRWSVVERVRNSCWGHELAILAEPQWFVSRAQTAKLLAQHVDQAAAWGFRPTLLALQGLHTVSELDLLVRHQIRVVREPMAPHGSHRKSSAPEARPLSARFGVWLAPVHCVVGRHIAWWRGGSWWTTYQVVRLVRHGPAIISVGFDPLVATRDQVDLGQLAVRLFRRLDRARRRKTVTVMPLSQAILSVARCQTGLAEGMESVLRHSA